jgi:hypothetical protein
MLAQDVRKVMRVLPGMHTELARETSSVGSAQCRG